jgi:hypothetical protein
MPPFLKFLDSARRLIPMGMTRQQIFNFAKQEFGEINQLMQKQIDNLFKPRNPVGKKDEVFDSTVEKMQFDDAGKPFNPRNPLKKADGGRIGYAMGSEGIMQMASVDDPFYRGGEEDEHSFRMFNKPYKELNADELEEFREEMMRLMNKFASAPDPMDEKNSMMENLSRQYYNKPLKDLSEDEILDLEEAFDDLVSQKDRGAPSIKLADGGITRIGLKDGTFKKLFFNEESPILSGFNTAALFDFVVATKDLAGPLLGMADGGRAAYKDGPKDPRRRGFMKAAVGIASMLPFGITKGVKMAKPAIEKSVELAAPALNKIVETVMTLGKTISQSGRRVKEMVTKKKHKDIEVEEDVMDGSYIIKKDNKEIYYKPGRRDEMGIDDDIIEVIDKTVKKAGGGIARMLGE